VHFRFSRAQFCFIFLLLLALRVDVRLLLLLFIRRGGCVRHHRDRGQRHDVKSFRAFRIFRSKLLIVSLKRRRRRCRQVVKSSFLKRFLSENVRVGDRHVAGFALFLPSFLFGFKKARGRLAGGVPGGTWEKKQKKNKKKRICSP
jgi:hypothetical protein